MQMKHENFQRSEVLLRKVLEQPFHRSYSRFRISNFGDIAEILMEFKSKKWVWQLSEVILESKNTNVSASGNVGRRVEESEMEFEDVHRGNGRNIVKPIRILQVERITTIKVRADEFGLAHPATLPVDAFVFHRTRFYGLNTGRHDCRHKPIFGQALCNEVVAKHGVGTI